MSNILPILKKFDLTKADIVEKYQKDGRKIIGCSPYHLPVELVYASGMRPMGLWGSYGEISMAKEYFPAFYCSIVQRILELSLNGTFDCLSGIMVSIQ